MKDLLVTDKITTGAETTFAQRKKDLERQEEEEEKKRHHGLYTDWYQINRRESYALDKCVKENPTAYRILLFILEKMNRLNACIMSYKVIEEILQVKPATITRAIRYLKTNGYISVKKTGTSNIYIVNPEIAWSSWSENVKYCEFDAHVVISKSEQDEIKRRRTSFDRTPQVIKKRSRKAGEEN